MTAYYTHSRLARSIDTYLGRRLPPMHCADRLEPCRAEIEAEKQAAISELSYLDEERKLQRFERVMEGGE